jgi:hypothetical protein
MNLHLTREIFTDTETLGRLFVNAQYFCFTLEDKDRHLEDGGEKIHGETAIPRGTYKLILDMSQRFQRAMPHLLDVPDFTGIRIHAGNGATDTEGCILVGTTRLAGRIGNSRIAYTKLMDILDEAYDKGESITLSVS